jgi:hypothetical protein
MEKKIQIKGLFLHIYMINEGVCVSVLDRQPTKGSTRSR